MPTVLKSDPDAPLTAEQVELIEEFRKKWDVLALFSSVYPGVFRGVQSVGMSHGDIESCCWAGVIRAAQLFDPSFGCGFKSYAVYWMRSKVVRASDVCQMNRARAKGLDLLDGDFRSSHFDDCSDGWEMFGVTSRELNPVELSRQSELRERVAEVLKVLPAKYRRVVELRFGLGPDDRPRTMEEVAAEFGVTRQRIDQILVKCYERIRDPLRLVASNC